MNAIELEAQKASLAREILCMDDKNTIDKIWLLLRDDQPVVSKKKRDIGFLKGKAKVIFHDDWSMTPEELGMV